MTMKIEIEDVAGTGARTVAEAGTGTKAGGKNEILRKKAKPVRSVTGELRSFIVDMTKTMNSEDGVGLAAPQVGRSERLIVCKINPSEKNEVIIPMLNPVILQVSEETDWGEEGCLSVPNTWGEVERFSAILVRYMNLKGKEMTLELNGFNARIVQHEIDHLAGVLFTDKAKNIRKEKLKNEPGGKKNTKDRPAF